MLGEKLKSPHDWKIEKILLSKPNSSARKIARNGSYGRRKSCGTVPYPRVPCTRSTVPALFASPPAPLPVYSCRLSGSVLQLASNVDKKWKFSFIFVIFKSGSSRFQTCFEKYFIFHNKSIFWQPKPAPSLPHPTEKTFVNNSGYLEVTVWGHCM